jgi:hypothetical protein
MMHPALGAHSVTAIPLGQLTVVEQRTQLTWSNFASVACGMRAAKTSLAPATHDSSPDTRLMSLDITFTNSQINGDLGVS